VSFAAGHVKRNPTTGEVAVRTHFSDDTPEVAHMAWLVATLNIGARTARTSDVQAWEDLYIPANS
jgi:hypothetical protein